jgi:hypothetical protein
MNGKDELRELWCTQPYAGVTEGEELMKLIEKKTKRFDRIIRVRNFLECAGATVVAVMYAVSAARTHDGIERASFIVIAASAVWIMYFLLRSGHAPADADPSQDLSAYRRGLVERYDRQIRLLKSVKYWYLLPPYVGLLIGTVGVLLDHTRSGGIRWQDSILPAIYTAFFAFVWWLNEIEGVARLEAERARLLSLADEKNGPESIG